MAHGLTFAATRGGPTRFSFGGFAGLKRLAFEVSGVPDPSRFQARLTSVPMDAIAFEEFSSTPFVCVRATGAQLSAQEAVRIVYVREGTLHVERDGAARVMEPGEIVALAAWKPFRMTAPDPVRFASVIIPRRHLRIPPRLLSDFSPVRGEPAFTMWEAMIRALGAAPPRDQTLQAELLSRAVIDVARAMFTEERELEEEPRSRPQLILRAHDVIEREFMDPSFKTSDVAQRLGMSERSLRRLFESEELTVAQCIKKRRVDAAARFLLSTAAPFEQIAKRVGFSSVDSAYRAFRSSRGATPEQYRREMLK